MGGKWRLLWLALILGMLAGCAAPPEVPMEESKPQPQRTQKIAETLAFPHSAPGSMLILETMQSYSGPYWEDGSGRQVENVAGLMVCNPTSVWWTSPPLQWSRGERPCTFLSMPFRRKAAVWLWNTQGKAELGRRPKPAGSCVCNGVARSFPESSWIIWALDPA